MHEYFGIGPVFHSLPKRSGEQCPKLHRVDRLVPAIGEAAKSGLLQLMIVRRSFGERWVNLVMPHILQDLIQPHSIETAMKFTAMKFYVGRNAEVTSETLYSAVSGNTSDYSHSPKEKSPSQVVTATDFMK